MMKTVRAKLTLLFLLIALIADVLFYLALGAPNLTAAAIIRAFLVSGVVAFIAALIIAHKFAQPIIAASELFWHIARGQLRQSATAPVRVVNDERGHLLLAYQEIVQYLTQLQEFMQSLSQGDFDREFECQSQTDELGQACGQLAEYTQHLAQIISSMEEGHLFAEIVPVSDQDELGHALHHMSANLQAMLAHFKENVDPILTLAQDVMTCSSTEIQSIETLLTSAESTSSSMAEMQASVEEVGLNIEALAASIESTSSSINQMGSSISQVTRNSEKLSEFVKTTSGIIAQAVSAMEKVSENAENSKNLSSDTMRDASKGQEAMKSVNESVRTISETVESAATIIKQLEARSDEIGSVLDVIDEIADQTSLLALNASIIAAQAGEHGKGFAVVADEIKELATRVSESTKEISRIVKTVQQDSAKAAKAMDEGNAQVKEGQKLVVLAGDALEKIILGAQWSANVANDIAEAIQEQTAMNQTIEESIQDVVNVASENTRATREQEIGASRVTEAVNKMTTLADQVHRATVEQTKGAAEVINATEEMAVLVRNSVKNTQHLLEAAKELTEKAELLTSTLDEYGEGGTPVSSNRMLRAETEQ
ncbi:hypothetical protein GF339_15040 [candidate division KSB3 bacterium]|uniref:Methyl-accepting transducer domain-containing protein n=1 Tax=candidate division KSB3 bacterium TaxID=2044937 RepID=A0A9D5JXF3_9BACT|nr:hypothetical protein [candidate division KSB3 bacterium]MBD3325900.1 hypothetical protein [candidate division KSB3 bacterium]